MTNFDSIPQDLRPLFQRQAALTKLIEKCHEAYLGEEPQMRKELHKVEKIAVQQLRDIDAKIRAYNAQKTV